MAAVHSSTCCNNQYGDLCLLSQWLLRKRKEKRFLAAVRLCRHRCYDQRQYRRTVLLRYDVLDTLVFTLLRDCLAILLCSCNNCYEPKTYEELSNLACRNYLGMCWFKLHSSNYSYAVHIRSNIATSYGPLALAARRTLLRFRCHNLFVQMARVLF